MDDQQAPRSGVGEAKVVTLCGSTGFSRVRFQKVRMADEVYVVDPGGFVGESTRREIAFAESLGKPVRYLSRERSARTGDGPRE